MGLARAGLRVDIVMINVALETDAPWGHKAAVITISSGLTRKPARSPVVVLVVLVIMRAINSYARNAIPCNLRRGRQPDAPARHNCTVTRDEADRTSGTDIGESGRV